VANLNMTSPSKHMSKLLNAHGVKQYE
jgi:hypothetical protein